MCSAVWEIKPCRKKHKRPQAEKGSLDSRCAAYDNCFMYCLATLHLWKQMDEFRDGRKKKSFLQSFFFFFFLHLLERKKISILKRMNLEAEMNLWSEIQNICRLLNPTWELQRGALKLGALSNFLLNSGTVIFCTKCSFEEALDLFITIYVMHKFRWCVEVWNQKPHTRLFPSGQCIIQ